MAKESRLIGKIKKANEIAACSAKIKYYQDALKKLKSSPKSFHEASTEIRIAGTKTIWVDLNPAECELILHRKLNFEKNKINQLL